MPKLLIRIVTILLVPCLLTAAIPAQAFSPESRQSTFYSRTSLPVFNQQALSGRFAGSIFHPNLLRTALVFSVIHWIRIDWVGWLLRYANTLETAGKRGNFSVNSIQENLLLRRSVK